MLTVQLSLAIPETLQNGPEHAAPVRHDPTQLLKLESFRGEGRVVQQGSQFVHFGAFSRIPQLVQTGQLFL